jgi:hypothetical protein
MDTNWHQKEPSSFKFLARKFEIGPEMKNDTKNSEGQNFDIISPIKKWYKNITILENVI